MKELLNRTAEQNLKNKRNLIIIKTRENKLAFIHWLTLFKKYFLDENLKQNN